MTKIMNFACNELIDDKLTFYRNLYNKFEVIDWTKNIFIRLAHLRGSMTTARAYSTKLTPSFLNIKRTCGIAYMITQTSKI